MSKYTDFLNLFKWDALTDAEEEFDIEKALNENWDKVDTKLKDYIAQVNSMIETFKEEVNNSNNSFKTTVTEEITELESVVSNLSELVSKTQETYLYRLDITTAVDAGGQVTLPCYYKVRN